MTYEEWFETAKMLKRIYQREEKFMPDEDTVRLMYSMLDDLDYETVKQAVTDYIKSNKFSPTVADIREHYDAIKEQERSLTDTIKYNYAMCVQIFPREMEKGYGFKEFTDKVMTAKPEKRKWAASYIYERFSKVVYSGEEVPDFIEIIKGVK